MVPRHDRRQEDRNHGIVTNLRTFQGTAFLFSYSCSRSKRRLLPILFIFYPCSSTVNCSIVSYDTLWTVEILWFKRESYSHSVIIRVFFLEVLAFTSMSRYAPLMIVWAKVALAWFGAAGLQVWMAATCWVTAARPKRMEMMIWSKTVNDGPLYWPLAFTIRYIHMYLYVCTEYCCWTALIAWSTLIVVDQCRIHTN